MLRDLPKVLLHDHLDGGVRAQTVLDLAHDQSYEDLPADTASELSNWFLQSGAGSLETYLEAFVHTVGVMQTEEALTRVAYEAVIDYASSGVVYAEPRFAPSLHQKRGLTHTRIVRAVWQGLRQGSSDTGTEVGLILVAMRDATDSAEVARAAVQLRQVGVVGFDLAGPERGFPAADHRAACDIALQGSLGLTLHAGEGDGVPSIADALDCGAARLGHGVRIVEDCTVRNGRITRVGPTARRVLEAGITLEVSVNSELHTGLAPTPADHPVGLLYRSGFAVTINTDNRLMSDTDMVREFGALASDHGFTPDDLRVVTETAVNGSFCAEKDRLLKERIWPGYDL